MGHTGGACKLSDILDSLLWLNFLVNVAEAHRLRLGRRRHDGERLMSRPNSFSLAGSQQVAEAQSVPRPLMSGSAMGAGVEE